MVNKEEYNAFIKELTYKDKEKIKTLSGKFLALSLVLLFFGVFIFVRQLYIFIVFRLFFADSNFIFGILLMITGISMILIRSKNKKFCKENYREIAINYMLKDCDHYFNKDGWPLSWEFEHSQMSKSFELCSTSDCLIINIPNDDGNSSKVDLKICDLYAYNMNRDSEGNNTHTKVYKGMFGCAEFPRKFKCVLGIDVNYKIRGLKLEKVELEDIKFNNTFKVISNDQIESRYILTPSMMENLLWLESKFKGLKVVFVGNYLYIGANNIDMFELGSTKSENVTSMFEGLYDEINVILKIVKEIKDNNKIFKTSSKKRVNKKELKDE